MERKLQNQVIWKNKKKERKKNVYRKIRTHKSNKICFRKNHSTHLKIKENILVNINYTN